MIRMHQGPDNTAIILKRVRIGQKSVRRVEQLLWHALNGRAFRKYNFRRRFNFGVFILDFYSPKSKLAVEIAGDPRTFSSPDEYARRRREYIELYDIAIMHVTPTELSDNLDAVLTKIREVAKRRSESPIPLEEIFSPTDTAATRFVVPLD